MSLPIKEAIETVIEDRTVEEVWLGVLVKQEEFLLTADSSRYLTVFAPLFSIQILKMLELYEARERISEGCAEGIQSLPEAKLLIVDDNRLNLEIAQSLMEPYEMEIDCVVSGKDAIDVLLAKDYDIVFMDYMMPEMDGMETLKRICRLPEEKYKRLSVVVLTADAIEGARERYLENGFDGFLTKPIDMKEIGKVLKRLVRCLK